MGRWPLSALAVVALLVTGAIVLPWPPETWTAIAAWATAGVAGAAGFLALRQLAEARRLRLEQAQPYVAVYMDERREVDERFHDLVIANFGKTAAFNVEVT